MSQISNDSQTLQTDSHVCCHLQYDRSGLHDYPFTLLGSSNFHQLRVKGSEPIQRQYSNYIRAQNKTQFNRSNFYENLFQYYFIVEMIIYQLETVRIFNFCDIQICILQILKKHHHHHISSLRFFDFVIFINLIYFRKLIF